MRPSDDIIYSVLEETATPEQAEEVAKWFATDEGRAWLETDMTKNASRFFSGEKVYSDIPSEEMLQEIIRRINQIIRRRRWQRWTFRAAAVLIPCGLIIAAWLNLSNRIGGSLLADNYSEQVSAVYGERKEVIFQDGSKVWLNAGTNISYPKHFGIRERKIRLDGEAFFEVSPNASRPFIIEVGNATVRVLGTTFNIRAYNYEPTIDIVLMEGKIEFRYNTTLFSILPSQKLVYNKEAQKGQLSSEDNISRNGLWRDNIIYFRDAPLKEVIATLERWYDVKFEVVDEAAYECSFSLQTPDLPLPELLEEIQNISPLRCKMEDKVVKIRRN